LIRLASSGIGLFGYWTRFGSKPRFLNAVWSPLALRLIAFLDLALGRSDRRATRGARQIDVGVVEEERCHAFRRRMNEPAHCQRHGSDDFSCEIYASFGGRSDTPSARYEAMERLVARVGVMKRLHGGSRRAVG